MMDRICCTPLNFPDYLESEVLFFCLLADLLHCNSALDRADEEAGFVRECRDTPGLKIGGI